MTQKPLDNVLLLHIQRHGTGTAGMFVISGQFPSEDRLGAVFQLVSADNSNCINLDWSTIREGTNSPNPINDCVSIRI